MNIGLFGGAFDPPHIGHQTVAKTILQKKICDQVWFVPTFLHPFRKKIARPEDRIKMLELILVPGSRIELCEIERSSISYTYETLEELSKKFPEHSFSWIIGADNLPYFQKWHRYTEILEHYTVYVYPRSDYSLSPLYKNMVVLKDCPLIVASSSKIREAILRHESFSSMVTPQLETYIQTHRLYQ